MVRVHAHVDRGSQEQISGQPAGPGRHRQRRKARVVTEAQVWLAQPLSRIDEPTDLFWVAALFDTTDHHNDAFREKPDSMRLSRACPQGYLPDVPGVLNTAWTAARTSCTPLGVVVSKAM